MRFGIDLGGTKTEIMALAPDGKVALRRRISTAKDYESAIRTLTELVTGAEGELDSFGSVGIAIPGSESFGSDKINTGLIKNANTTYLIGKPLRQDLEKALGREVRLANDANCFALSEASDGAAAGAGTVFGVIAGTGVGGGVVIDGKVLGGAHGIGGEWGHIPLPAPSVEEVTEAPLCYCGKRGCLEVWCSGPALARDFLNDPLRPSLAREPATATSPFEKGEDPAWTAELIAASDHPAAIAAVDRLVDRFARAMATMVNILDPDVIVMGGGLSNVERLYRDLPPLVETYGFNLGGPPKIVKNRHGDSSGVRGAAWLWPA
ncbi:MAG: ROK family protein [Alphaproteobacteria bacterium]|nr:ROK family protein [Alphaproteobacteria bacterium]